ncbi:MAG: DMT family transporter, partial [Chloroflexi bacterium]|nr:DMT family transporter [Chloroflexota bacterium]
MSKTTNNSTDFKKRGISDLMLLLTAILWGSGFLAQRLGADNVTSFTFNAFRYILASLTLLILAKFRLPTDRESLKIIFWAGLVSYAGSTCQQTGMKYTSIGNTGFITTIYVPLVPVISYLLFREKVKKQAFLAAFIAMIGLYLLSTAGNGLEHMSIGDLIVFIGSFFWAMHIIVVSKAENIPAAQFSAGQFLVTAMLHLISWAVIDGAPTANLISIAPAILYSGIIVVGFGFTLQAIGKKNSGSAEAAIILGLESVFAMIFGTIFYGERFNLIQAIGAILIFFSIIVSVWSNRQSAVE